MLFSKCRVLAYSFLCSSVAVVGAMHHRCPMNPNGQGTSEAVERFVCDPARTLERDERGVHFEITKRRRGRPSIIDQSHGGFWPVRLVRSSMA